MAEAAEIAERRRRTTPDVWLDRTADYILHHGVSSFSIRALASKYKVSSQALINHFGTRDKLIRRALKRAFQRDLLVLEGMLRQMQSIPDLFRDIVRELQRAAFYRMNATQIELYAAAALEPDEHSEFNVRTTKRLHAIIESQIRREGIAEEDVRRVTGFLVATLRGLVLEALGGQGPEDLRSIAEQVTGWYQAQLQRQA